jgi:hypothetical protein
MYEFITTILLTLLSFIGMTIIYFIKLSFTKLEVLQIEINALKLEIEKIRK